MPEQYPWKRFWYPRETSLALLDGGYLAGPEIEWAYRLTSENLIPLADLASIPCLILLGEPGLGKSQELHQQYILTRDSLKKTTLWFDLGAYQDQSMLMRELFDNPIFQEWTHGTDYLHLFLDSLDECPISISTLARFLASKFALYRTHLVRLTLHIACRTAEWPAFLEDHLRDLWGNTNVRTFRLAPLRREDVRIAASSQGVNANQFLDEVDRNAVVSFAHRPVTLSFLLKQYREHGTFPPTQQAIYEEGCRILCRETSRSRRSAHFTGNFSDWQRLEGAARLAYLMVWTNRSEVWDGGNPGDAPSGCLQLYECSGGAGYTVPIIMVTDRSIKRRSPPRDPVQRVSTSGRNSPPLARTYRSAGLSERMELVDDHPS